MRKGIDISKLYVPTKADPLFDDTVMNEARKRMCRTIKRDYDGCLGRDIFSEAWCQDVLLGGDSVPSRSLRMINPTSLGGLTWFVRRLCATKLFQSAKVRMGLILDAGMWISSAQDAQRLCCWWGSVAAKAPSTSGGDPVVFIFVESHFLGEMHEWGMNAHHCDPFIGQFGVHEADVDFLVCFPLCYSFPKRALFFFG